MIIAQGYDKMWICIGRMKNDMIFGLLTRIVLIRSHLRDAIVNLDKNLLKTECVTVGSARVQ